MLILEIILLTAGIMGLFSEEGIVADESNMEVQVNGGEYLAERQGYYIDESYICSAISLPRCKRVFSSFTLPIHSPLI